MNDPVKVLYDGDCGFCGRTVRVLRKLDVLNQIEWVDFRSDPSGVDPARLEHEMAAISHGRISFGFSAYRALSWRVPALWLALPFLYLPGARWLGDRAYQAIARRRYGICRITPHKSKREPQHDRA